MASPVVLTPDAEPWPHRAVVAQRDDLVDQGHPGVHDDLITDGDVRDGIADSRRALTGEPIEIFGDGSQRRDCVYVDDVVAAFLAAASDAAIGSVYNVGHAVDHSLAEIASKIVDAAGRGGDVRFVPWPDDHQRIDIGSFQTDGTTIGAESRVEADGRTR